MGKIDENYILDHFDEAVREGYIQAYYQPIIRTLTGEICSMETLARWEDHIHGTIYPEQFIDVLEKNGRICELDMYMMEKVCLNYRNFLEKGLSPVMYSVNLSRLDFNDKNLFDRILSIFKTYDVPHSAVHLEVTESVLLQNTEIFFELFRKFHEAGFEIWMDDFGSGYASLNVLKDYNFDLIKIDMEFLSDMSERSKKIISSIINMAKILGMHTLVEGVESEEQVEFLKDIGCEMLQGYYFSKPMKEQEVMQMVEESERMVEDPVTRAYISAAGMINTLSSDPLNEYSRCIWKERGSEITARSKYPLALLEFCDGSFRFVYSNEAYDHELSLLGFWDRQDAERKINDRKRAFYEGTVSQMESAAKKGIAVKKNFVLEDVCYSLTMMVVAKNEKKTMMALNIDVFCRNGTEDRREEINKYHHTLFYYFELLIIMNPMKDSATQLYSKMTFDGRYGFMRLREGIRQFAEKEIFSEDKNRYLEFMDMRTIEDRILTESCHFLQQCFRLRISEGEYQWCLLRLTKMPTQENQCYMFSVQRLTGEEIRMIETYYHSGELYGCVG